MLAIIGKWNNERMSLPRQHLYHTQEEETKYTGIHFTINKEPMFHNTWRERTLADREALYTKDDCVPQISI